MPSAGNDRLRRDESSFYSPEQLLEYERKLRLAVKRRLVGHEHLIEDVVAIGLSSLSSARSRGIVLDDPIAYACRSAINQVAAALRQEGRAELHADLSEPAHLSLRPNDDYCREQWGSDPARALGWSELRRAMVRLLELLGESLEASASPDEVKLFRARMKGNQTWINLATSLGVPANRLRKRHSRLLEKLLPELFDRAASDPLLLEQLGPMLENEDVFVARFHALMDVLQEEGVNLADYV